MSRDSAYLLDIFKAAKLALSYLGGKTKEEFFKDTQCQDAVIRRFGYCLGHNPKRFTASDQST